MAWHGTRTVLEVEAKMELLAPGALRDRLQALGATPQPTEDQDDLYFQHPSRDLAATDEAFRLRRTPAGMDLTYKGPKRGEGAKVRTEHVVQVQDDPQTMLESLGFQPAARIVKRREPWQWGDVHVSIDTINGLGTFAEVEVVSADEAGAQEMVEEAVRALGLNGAQRFTVSYLEMAVAAGLSTDV